MSRFGRRLARALRVALSSYGRDYCPQFAAAISYHVLFSLFPLAIFTVSITGLVLRNEQRRQEFVSWLLGALPLSQEAGGSVERAVEGLATPASLAGLAALVGFFWAAGGMIAAVRIALAAVWKVPRRRPVVRAKALDLLIVLGASVLVLVLFGLTVFLQVVTQAGEEATATLEPVSRIVSVAGVLSEILLPLAVTFGTLLLLYRVVPPVRSRFAEIWPASLLAAVALQAAVALYAVYLTSFSSYNVVYGSLGAVVGFLFLVYIASTIFLFGAEIAAAWPDAAVESAEPKAGALPLRQRLARAARRLVFEDPPAREDDRPL